MNPASFILQPGTLGRLCQNPWEGNRHLLAGQFLLTVFTSGIKNLEGTAGQTVESRSWDVTEEDLAVGVEERPREESAAASRAQAMYRLDGIAVKGKARPGIQIGRGKKVLVR